ncbi:hypothetical protein ACQI5H_14355 [Mycobacterium heidelbergense]|uniref:hypothetical protein n=1 Tax=Mycobacterium heidelbergense TaxID=53376 RepID=UPI003CE7DB89
MGSEEKPPNGGEPDSDKPAPAEPPEGEDARPEEDDSAQYPSGGSMEFQDAATTKPRPATPAELRAREKFAKKQQEAEEARLEAEAKRRRQRRVLMGSAAAVGVVGVVAALGYWALSAPTVTAQCVRDDPNGQPVIVPDSYCTDHTAGLNGFFFFGGHQYRYYYGSSGSVGSRPIGGTTSAPKGATIKTKSGSTISRGGLGGKLGGGKGSGS